MQTPPINYSALSATLPLKNLLKTPEGKGILVPLIIGALGVFAGCITLFIAEPSIGFTLISSSSIALFIAFLKYGDAKNSIRRARFAADNNFSYQGPTAFTQRPGVVYNQGREKYFRDTLTTTTQSFREITNYQFTTGYGRAEEKHYYTILGITLPRNLPNIVLDSKKNNNKIGSNLPVGFSSEQKLELEGDFNNYFTLYVPEQYKTDALYIFTPDVMQALITTVQDYDCEIIDDTFYVYMPHSFFYTQQEFESILTISQTLKKELGDQTDRYTDEKVSSRALNIVHEDGKRIKTKVRILPIIMGILFFAIFIISMALPVILDLIGVTL